MLVASFSHHPESNSHSLLVSVIVVFPPPFLISLSYLKDLDLLVLIIPNKSLIGPEDRHRKQFGLIKIQLLLSKGEA